MKKVSVIIPAYNAEPFIEQCAKSVLHQTLTDIEILFIDDGSTDGTGEILDKLTAGSDYARVIHQKNTGLYKTRETGLSLATGEYIGWVDADDFLEPRMYETLYNAATENDSELAICDYSWYPKKIRTKEKWFREYKGTADAEFVEQNSQVWNKIVKRELLERLQIGSYFTTCFDEIYIYVLMEAKNPVTIAQPLYHYRVCGGTMSSTYTDILHYRSFVEASKALCEVMRPIAGSPYWNDYFRYRIVYYLLMTMLVAANCGDKVSYVQNRSELLHMVPKYKDNQHFRKILRRNYGRIRAIVIGDVIPLNYGLARAACRIGFRKKECG